VTIAQLLHGVTVWGLILGMSAYADRVVVPHLRSSAQATLAMVGVGLGGIVSNTLSGLLIDAYGVTTPATVAGATSGLLALAIPWILRGDHDTESAEAGAIRL
jgi:hypothetical protein